MNQPGFWNRFCAALCGEISADTLEAYRRASLAVYDALDHLDSHRQKAKADGLGVWDMAPAHRAEVLCSWNAFVLQTLGDRLLDADYEGDTHTVGFVPPVTADQILRFYTPVEGWLNRSQQAHANPDFKLDLAVPAAFPEWSEVEPCPNSHLIGMLEAMRAVRDHTAAALTFLEESPAKTEEQKKALHAVRQVKASAFTKARYAEDMMSGNPSVDIHERVEEYAKDAIEGLYLLGQLLAMPELALKLNQDLLQPPPAGEKAHPFARVYPPSNAPTGTRLALPNEPGFDLWCLTAPDAKQKLQQDREAVRALKMLWQLDPDPRLTLEIQSQINAALEAGIIAPAKDRYGKRLGYFFCAPWAQVFEARRTVTLGGHRLAALQQFVFNVTCEGVNLGAPFEREIMVANFTPTTKFEYGDPNEEPDH